MTTYAVRLPDIGEGIAEAEIVAWHVAVGDVVKMGDALVDVMTDKATVELPSPVAGTVSWIGGEPGDVVAVGSELVRLDVDGARPGDAPVVDAPVAAVAAEQATDPATLPSPFHVASKSLAAPAVRQRAADLGVDLATVPGSGPDGRVVHRDLDEFLTRSRRATGPRVAAHLNSAGQDEVESIKIIGLRRNIAQRMQTAKARIPHFTYVEEVDVTELERLRAELNDESAGEGNKLTVLPFLMRAIVRAVRDHPEMNARFDDDEGVVHRYKAVHLGVAVQTSAGLMVPVVRHVEARDLWNSADEVGRLSEGARAATLHLDELTGSTITLTSLGRLGGVASTPIINHPEVAVIGVNKISVRPVWRDGAFVPRQMMNLSSSFDHRVIDGADAAEFIQQIKALIETPALMFITE